MTLQPSGHYTEVRRNKQPFLQCLLQMWDHLPQTAGPHIEKYTVRLHQEESKPNNFS